MVSEYKLLTTKLRALSNIPTKENLFWLGETDFLASGNHFTLHFSETLGSDSFSPSSGKVFFKKRNPSFRQVETDFLAKTNRFLCSESFLVMETVTDLSGN